jgi:choline dehydrogenase
MNSTKGATRKRADRSSRKKWLAWAGVLSAGALAVYVGARLLSAAKRKRGEAALVDQVVVEKPREIELKESYDFVVVGSGAGGGPLAANLAKAGFTVLLLEAGGDCGASPYYQVPAFHGSATEYQDMQWNYFVRHYADDKQQSRDSKFVTEYNGIPLEQPGIWYPRAGTLGGCTAHNAMITVYPHSNDWDEIARITGDPSWRSSNMRKYFERLERCEYVARPGSPMLVLWRPAVIWLLRAFGHSSRHIMGENPGRHGFDGWLTTNVADIRLGWRDRLLVRIIKAAAAEALEDGLESHRGILRAFLAAFRAYLERGQSLLAGLQRNLDPNDAQVASNSPEGLVVTPLATHGGRRMGTREYIRETEKQFPNNLFVKTQALVTQVLLDDDNTATGVELLDGAHLYRADPRASQKSGEDGERRVVRATKEVILCAGAFNSPQLLKLSGIGPEEELTRLGIPVRVPLPGVGENLQDRYEVGIITKTKDDFSIFDGATFKPPEPGQKPDLAFRQWLSGKGLYTTNGAVIGIVKKSHKDLTDPDLFIFGLPSNFRGYFPGYADELVKEKNNFTWAILKGHTLNTAGRVTLRSNDPRDTPQINFHYFHEGSDCEGRDLESVVNGVKFVRGITEHASPLTASQILPDKSIDTDEEIRQFIQDEAWGHHASCSNKMGPKEDPMAVVDSTFRVHGTRKLRVVDASVFPRIPGFFIALPVYMISEKASDAIIADAKV